MHEYKCTCDPDQAKALKSIYTYPRQLVLDLPKWSIAYNQRIQNNYPPNVCIDHCIAEAIKELWDKGIETTGCCCGHNFEKGWVSVHPDCYIAMFSLGYYQRPVEIVEGEPMGLYTFYLPSKRMDHPESYCQRCGGPNPTWCAPNEIWNQVNGSRNGIICPMCFERAADKMGISLIFKAQTII